MMRKITLVMILTLLVAFVCAAMGMAQEKAVDEKWTDLPGKVSIGKPWKKDSAGKIFRSADGNMLKFMADGKTWKFDLTTKKLYLLGKNGMWVNWMTNSVFQRNNGAIVVIKAKDGRFRLDFKTPYKQAVKLGGLKNQDDLPTK